MWKKILNFFFQSCLESSETHFAILEGHFENFHSDPLGAPKGGQKNQKKLKSSKLQFEFEVI